MNKILIQLAALVSVLTISGSALADPTLWGLLYKKQYAAGDHRLTEIEAQNIETDFSYTEHGLPNAVEMAAKAGMWTLVRRMQSIAPHAITRDILKLAAIAEQNDIVDTYFLTTNPNNGGRVVEALNQYRTPIAVWREAGQDGQHIRGLITRDIIGRMVGGPDETDGDRAFYVQLLFPELPIARWLNDAPLPRHIEEARIDHMDRAGTPLEVIPVQYLVNAGNAGIVIATMVLWITKAKANEHSNF